MRPFAGDFKDETIDVGVERPAAGGELAQRQAGFIMHTEDRRDALQRPGANQGFRPAKILFRRLEQNPYSSRERRFAFFQQQRRPSITLV